MAVLPSWARSVAARAGAAPAFLAFGLHASLCQILYLREFLVVSRGSELSLAVVLGAWLLGITAGAAAGVPLARRLRRPFPLFAFLLLPLALALPAGLAAIRSLRLFLPVPAGLLLPLESLVLAALFVVFPTGLLVGAAFPAACAAARRAAGGVEGGKVIARVYALEALGSLIGGTAHSWLLVTALPAARTALLSGALLGAAGACFPRDGEEGARECPRRLRPLLPRGLLLLCALGLAWAGLASPGARLQRWSLDQRWQSLHPGMELLEALDTPYQSLEVGRFGEQLLFTAGGSLLAAYPDEYLAAQEAHFLLALHPDPRRVLLIGGAESGLLGRMLLHPRLERLVYLDLDPRTLELFRRHARGPDRRAFADPRLVMRAEDGRHFLRRQLALPAAEREAPFDLIAVSAPDPTTALINRLYTRQFFRQAARLLDRRGTFVCRVSASANYLGEEAGDLARSVFLALRSEFGRARATGGDRPALVATPDPRGLADLSPETLVERYRASGTEDPRFSPYAFYSLLEEERIRFTEDELARVGAGAAGPVANSDWHPAACLHTLRLWDRFAGGGAAPLLGLLLRVRPAWYLAGPLLLLACWAILPLAGRRRRSSGRRGGRTGARTLLLATVAGGFSGMALELVCLYAFQSVFGLVYRMIGLLVALFMLGLALGGISVPAAARRLGGREEGNRRLLLLGLAGLTLLALLSPPLLRLAAEGPWLAGREWAAVTCFLLWVALAGSCTGLIFPAAAALLLHAAGSRPNEEGGEFEAQARGAAEATPCRAGTTGSSGAQERRGAVAGAAEAAPRSAASARRPTAGGRIASAAGWVEAADHLGAAAGAMGIGLLAFPLLGLSRTCLLVAGVAAAGALRVLLEGAGEKRRFWRS